MADKTESNWRLYHWLPLLAIPTALAAGVYWAASALLGRLDVALSPQTLRSPATRLIVSICLLGGGYSLAKLRSKARVFYSLAEIAFGIASNWYSMEGLGSRPASDSGSTARLLILGGGMYLIGRGFANLLESTTKPSADPVLKWLLKCFDASAGVGIVLIEDGSWAAIRTTFNQQFRPPLRSPEAPNIPVIVMAYLTVIPAAAYFLLNLRSWWAVLPAVLIFVVGDGVLRTLPGADSRSEAVLVAVAGLSSVSLLVLAAVRCFKVYHSRLWLMHAALALFSIAIATHVTLLFRRRA